jgi:hypothetical protein
MMPSKLERPSTRLEVFIGCCLAACVHPTAAWRSGSTSVRMQFLFGYFVASYVLILGLLFLMPAGS